MTTTPPLVYAAFAGIGLLHEDAAQSLIASAHRQATHGTLVMDEIIPASEQAADTFADLIGAPHGTVARTGCTSDGVIAVAHMTKWQHNDAILLFRGEFPANTTPWQTIAQRRGLRIIWLDANIFQDPSRAFSELDAALKQGVAMVAMSLVQFQTGLRMPVEEITARAHAAGAKVFVDGIQGIGAVRFDAVQAKVDWLAVGGHKWLRGPIGTGFLYGKPTSWAQAEPALASWLSHVDPLRFLSETHALTYDRALSTGPSIVEGGVRNYAGFAALGLAMKALLATGGPGVVFNHVQAWHDAVEPALAAMGFVSLRAAHLSGRSTLLCLQPPSGVKASDLTAQLQAKQVIVSCPEGNIRIAPGLTTHISGTTHLLHAVQASLMALMQ